MNRLRKNAMPIPLLSKGVLLCSSLCKLSDPTITQASIQNKRQNFKHCPPKSILKQTETFSFQGPTSVSIMVITRLIQASQSFTVGMSSQDSKPDKINSASGISMKSTLSSFGPLNRFIILQKPFTPNSNTSSLILLSASGAQYGLFLDLIAQCGLKENLSMFLI